MRIWKILTLVLALIIVVGGSFLGYNYVKGNNEAKLNNEMTMLQTTFIQQYGNNAIIEQLVSPQKVFAAKWRYPSENITRISWNIGGLWVTVFSSPTQ